MADLPRESKTHDLSAHETADREQLRATARSGYQGHATVVQLSEAVKERDRRRVESEREAAKVHYLGIPRKPR